MEIVRILPKAWMSFAIGRLVEVRLPQFLARPLLRWFAGRYGLNMAEATRPLESYRSIAELFVRDIKAESRPIGEQPVHPADGVLRNGGVIRDNFLEQIKDIRYPLEDLLAEPEEAKRFCGGYYMSVYLSPKDYHHVHSPVTGSVRKVTYIPGALWPVNDWSLQRIHNLFAINERVVVYLSTSRGEVAVVMVGATNVGRISLSFDDLLTNAAPWKPKKVEQRQYRSQPMVVAGQRIGTFHLGSSVVLLFDAQYAATMANGDTTENQKVCFGSSIA